MNVNNRLILSSFLIVAGAGLAGFILRPTKARPNNPVEVRAGDWPISLETVRENSHTAYYLEFRDQQVVRGVVMDTLPFPDLTQLRYFGKALSALKAGTNGDIARFKDYTITRAEKKYSGVWFLLKYQWGSTDFKQPEADILINTIRGM